MNYFLIQSEDPVFFEDSACIPGTEQHEWRWNADLYDFERLCVCGEAWRDADDAEWHGPAELN